MRGRIQGKACFGALLVGVLFLVAAACASARVTLVATGTPELPFLDVSTNAVVARLALPGPSRAIAVWRDGQRGFVAAGGSIVAFDVDARLELLRTTLGPPDVTDVELSPAGRRCAPSRAGAWRSSTR